MMEFFYDLFGIYGPEFIGPTTLPYSIFVALLKLSLPACVLIAAVLLARQLLRKAPKWISCALWALVALRLICPFTIESPLSVMPYDVGSGKAVDAWMESYVPGGYTVIYEGEPGYDEAVGSDRLPVQSKDGINYVVTGVGVSSVPETVGNRILPHLFYVWVIGMAAMLLYAAVSYQRLKRRTAITVPWAEGILMCDQINSPFILGVFRPRIFLPSRMTEPQRSRVLAHEKAHLKRHDHWWKPLGFLLLSVYWFNPLIWIAYILLCRDIEMACDERVVRDMDTAERADYAQAMLDCSRSRRVITACPLAFGEVGVKERVKGVLNYKKPAFWMIFVAIAACIVMAICFLTSPIVVNVPDTMEDDEQEVCRLTLDDVRILSQKGEALSWNDFAGYEGKGIGSGLYIMQYIIDDVFDVLVGGGSTEEKPMYIHLRNRDINAWIDIRTDDVNGFLAEYAADSIHNLTKSGKFEYAISQAYEGGPILQVFYTNSERIQVKNDSNTDIICYLYDVQYDEPIAEATIIARGKAVFSNLTASRQYQVGIKPVGVEIQITVSD